MLSNLFEKSNHFVLCFRTSFVEGVPIFVGFSSFVLQMICLVAIIATKVKHFIEERYYRKKNAVEPLNNDAKKQPISFIAINLVQRKTHSRDQTNDNRISNDNENNKGNIPRNTTIYNKNLIEVFHISFISVVMMISLAKVNMIHNIKSKGDAENFSHSLMILLDIAPATMVAVLLPLIIISRHHDMQKWIKSFFRKP